MRILWPAVRFKGEKWVDKNRVVHCDYDRTQEETNKRVGRSFFISKQKLFDQKLNLIY